MTISPDLIDIIVYTAGLITIFACALTGFALVVTLLLVAAGHWVYRTLDRMNLLKEFIKFYIDKRRKKRGE